MTTQHRPAPIALADALDERASRHRQPLPFATTDVAERTPPAHESARPCGVPLLDDLLGGVMPGSVTVVRTSWSEVALAVAAEIVVGIAREGRRVLVICGADLRPVVDVLVARAGRITLDQVRSLELGRDAEAYVKARGGVEPLRIDLVRGLVDSRDLEQTPDVIVVIDGDAGGSLDGTTALPRWREHARALGVPVFVAVSGAAAGWSAAEDSHLELVRTHVGPRSVWLLARGVVSGRAVDTLRLTLTRPTARLRVLARNRAESTVPPLRCVERHWVDEASSPIDELALTRIVGDDAWTPASAREADDVLISLAMLALEETPLRAPTLVPLPGPTLERTISACGGLDRWMHVLAATGVHHDRSAWSRVERGALPLGVLPETAPAAWRAARRLRWQPISIRRTAR